MTSVALLSSTDTVTPSRKATRLVCVSRSTFSSSQMCWERHVPKVSYEVGLSRGHIGQLEHYACYMTCDMVQWLGIRTCLNKFLLRTWGWNSCAVCMVYHHCTHSKLARHPGHSLSSHRAYGKSLEYPDCLLSFLCGISQRANLELNMLWRTSVGVPVDILPA